jgi:hypothetical protein
MPIHYWVIVDTTHLQQLREDGIISCSSVPVTSIAEATAELSNAAALLQIGTAMSQSGWPFLQLTSKKSYVHVLL